MVETAAGDLRDGTYTLNGTSTDLPVFCADECVYTKDGASPQDFYCFGPGDVDSTCQVLPSFSSQLSYRLLAGSRD